MQHTSKYFTLDVPSLDQLHDMLDQHDAWTMPFYAFEQAIKTTRNGNETTHVTYSNSGGGLSLKDKWEILQYTRKHARRP